MTLKIFSIFVTLFATLLVLQCVSCEEIVRPDILFIENPDTFPKIISPAIALSDTPRSNLVCTAALCSRVCWALGFRFGRCNVNRVCVCSNF